MTNGSSGVATQVVGGERLDRPAQRDRGHASGGRYLVRRGAGVVRRIAAYQRARGLSPNLKHGNCRGVYIKQARAGSVEEISHQWYERWGLPRWERTLDQAAPYKDGLS